MFGTTSADFCFHLGYFDGELTVEGVAAGLYGHVAQADADLRVLRVAAVRCRAKRVVRVSWQHERVASTHEARQIRRPR